MPNEEEKIRVALVEDTPSVRDNLAELMRESGDFEVIGIYGNGRSAIKGFKEEAPPQVAIVDLGLPDISGIEVIRHAAQMTPRIEPIAYTVFDDEVSLFLALKAGAVGYLLKESSGEQILDAVRETVRGGALISPTLARRLLREFNAPHEETLPELTPREREVLEHLVQGANYLNVAARLGIGAETVRTHIKSIYRKLHVSNRADVVRTAIERKLVKPA
jgi:DNA-binding NarL/FixJ family response regulator